VADVDTGGSSSPEDLVVYDGEIYFTAFGLAFELFSYDPATDLLWSHSDIYTGGDAKPNWLTVVP
jgi:hypothetical protein